MKLNLNLEKIFGKFAEKAFFKGKLRENALNILLALLLIIAIILLMPKQRPFEYGNLTVGSIAPKEIIAPFTFSIIKSNDILEKEKREARLRVPPVFRKNSDLKNVQILKIRTLLNDISSFFKNIESKRKLPQSIDNGFAELTELDSLLEQISTKYNIELTSEDLINVFNLYRKSELPSLSENLALGFAQIYDQSVLNVTKNGIEETKLVVVQDGLEEEKEVNEFLDLHEAREIFQDFLSKKYNEELEIQSFTSKLIINLLVPDLIYDQEVTRSRKEKAEREVPSTSGYVYENQRIIDSHEIVTEEVFQELQSLATALSERDEFRGGWEHFLFFIGQFVFAITVAFIIGFYLYFYRPKLYAQNKMLILITVIFLLQFLLAGLTSNILGWNYLSIPITFGPMLFSMLLDASVAFFGTVIISIVLGAAGGNNFYLALMTFVVGSIALYSVQKIRNRGQMFKAILYILLGYAVVNMSAGFIHFESIKKMLQDFTFYQIPNAVLVPTAVFLLIGLFEKFFDVTTDITLLELSDLNHPLLKRLSVEAPGTFHHSFVVGNLAEVAAKEIGANSLLARVGCYYHDIGKMQLSEYFVENQSGSVNKHEGLTPNMSSLILSKHVRAGLDMAEEYGLPLAVKKFIPEHHGTSIMSYFYHKAQESMDPKDINEDDFRYPGPKPQSRETAIAMLADTVEAASRTLPNPNMQRISALVDNLIEKRFQEGELDECDITLRELNKIKSAFIRVLMGIHHLRIEYPSENQHKEASKKGAKRKEKKEEIQNSILEKAMMLSELQNKAQKNDKNTGFNAKNRSKGGEKENDN